MLLIVRAAPNEPGAERFNNSLSIYLDQDRSFRPSIMLQE